MNDMQISPGVQYLHDRIRQADQTIAVLMEQGAAKDARIAELEKNQKPPKKSKD